jgi:hypothetical protein
MLLTAALGLLLISLTLPWLTINLFGQRSYSAFDNMQMLTDSQKEEEGMPAVVLSTTTNLKMTWS